MCHWLATGRPEFCIQNALCGGWFHSSKENQAALGQARVPSLLCPWTLGHRCTLLAAQTRSHLCCCSSFGNLLFLNTLAIIIYFCSPALWDRQLSLRTGGVRQGLPALLDTGVVVNRTCGISVYLKHKEKWRNGAETSHEQTGRRRVISRKNKMF